MIRKLWLPSLTLLVLVASSQADDGLSNGEASPV